MKFYGQPLNYPRVRSYKTFDTSEIYQKIARRGTRLSVTLGDTHLGTQWLRSVRGSSSPGYSLASVAPRRPAPLYTGPACHLVLFLIYWAACLFSCFTVAAAYYFSALLLLGLLIFLPYCCWCLIIFLLCCCCCLSFLCFVVAFLLKYLS